MRDLQTVAVLLLDSAQRLGGNLRDLLLGPSQVLLHLLGRLHAVGNVGARSFQPPLRECLQFGQLALLCIEFTRPVFVNFVVSVLTGFLQKPGAENLLLRLLRNIPVHRLRVQLKTVCHHLNEIHAASSATGALGINSRSISAAAVCERWNC